MAMLPNSRAAQKQCGELAPVHCPGPSLLLTERIAHLGIRREAAGQQDLSPGYVADGSFATEPADRAWHPMSALPR
jgi:hypothetical protein